MSACEVSFLRIEIMFSKSRLQIVLSAVLSIILIKLLLSLAENSKYLIYSLYYNRPRFH